MATKWRTLTRRDLTTFDTFATNVVLTTMELGAVGQIGGNGHAKIRGRNGATMTVARDTSAPHCRGNLIADLKRAFPEARTDTKKDSTMTSDSPEAGTIQRMLECPAKGCNEKLPTLDAMNAHVDAEHFRCKWEGCDYGPNGGPFVGTISTSLAGHTNVRHKGNKPWLMNRETAALHRAETVAKKKAAKTEAASHKAHPERGLPRLERPAAPVDDEGAQHIGPLSPEITSSTEPALVAVQTDGADTGEAEAKLALIREILGEDAEVVKLRKEVADLKAHMALVREAVGLDFDFVETDE